MSTRQPRGMTAAEAVKAEALEVIEEATHLLSGGTPAREVARRLDLSLAALEQRLRRSGATKAANDCSNARRWDR